MDYNELIENEKLFVFCLNTVKDGAGVYCLRGREYEVIEYIEDEECFIIESEDEELQIDVNDSDFRIVVY